MKCSCEAARSVRVLPAHFCANSAGVVEIAASLRCGQVERRSKLRYYNLGLSAPLGRDEIRIPESHDENREDHEDRNQQVEQVQLAARVEFPPADLHWTGLPDSRCQRQQIVES